MLNIGTAKEVIKEYRLVLDKGTVGETILRKNSWLPFSKAKIKFAYFVFVESVLETETETLDELKEGLVAEYALLSSFVPDGTAEKYAQNYEAWQTKKDNPLRVRKDEGLVKQYLAFTHTLGRNEAAAELRDLISDLTKREKR